MQSCYSHKRLPRISVDVWHFHGTRYLYLGMLRGKEVASYGSFLGNEKHDFQKYNTPSFKSRISFHALIFE